MMICCIALSFLQPSFSLITPQDAKTGENFRATTQSQSRFWDLAEVWMKGWKSPNDDQIGLTGVYERILKSRRMLRNSGFEDFDQILFI